MKVVLFDEHTTEGFKPFNLTMRIETEKEARLLWHVFNRQALLRAINDDTYSLEIYNKNIAQDLTDNDIRSFIAENVDIYEK